MSNSLLHIFNGDALVDIFKQTTIAGDYLVWREALVAGPTPNVTEETEWLKIRLKHLVSAYNVNEVSCKHDLLEQFDKLKEVNNYQEVILWFEADLFCQINLLYLMSDFALRRVNCNILRLIYLDNFADGSEVVAKNFSLSQLNSKELSDLFAKRSNISSSMLSLAAIVWDAYSSYNPKNIEKLLFQNELPISFVKNAMLNHLARFPSVKNGLGYIENKILELVYERGKSFSLLFKEFSNSNPFYGLGDSQLWLSIKILAEAENPLILLTPSKNNEFSLDTNIEITSLGKDILLGKENFIKQNNLNIWLGGVHLTNESFWCWDDLSCKLIHSKEM
jgi:hypothetical protein